MDNYFDQGIRQLEGGDAAGAVSSFSKALRLALGDLAEILMYRAIAYSHIPDAARAFADFEECLAMSPGYTEAYNERGHLWRQQGKYREALQDYTTALQMDEHFYQARYHRALCLEELGLPDDAERDLTRVIQENPTIAQAYEARGRSRAQQRHYDDAIVDFQRYLRMGGGREFDNHSEIQATIISLRVQKWFRWLIRR